MIETSAGCVVPGLVILAGLDGAFSGFRAAAGRDGRLIRRRADLAAQLLGLAVVTVLLGPVVILALIDGAPNGSWTPAGAAMLGVYLPYGLFVVVALLGYLTLPWRRRFLATALILGPFTLIRPLVALAGGVLGWRAVEDPVVRLGVVLAVAGVLAAGAVCSALVRRDLRRRARPGDILPA